VPLPKKRSKPEGDAGEDKKSKNENKEDGEKGGDKEDDERRKKRKQEREERRKKRKEKDAKEIKDPSAYLLAFNKHLRKATAENNDARLVQILKKLKKSTASVTIKSLHESGLGKTVNRLTKHKTQEVQDIAKELLDLYMAVMDDAIKTGDIGKLNLQKAEEKRRLEEAKSQAVEKESQPVKTEENSSIEAKPAGSAEENGETAAEEKPKHKLEAEKEEKHEEKKESEQEEGKEEKNVEKVEKEDIGEAPAQVAMEESAAENTHPTIEDTVPAAVPTAHEEAPVPADEIMGDAMPV